MLFSECHTYIDLGLENLLCRNAPDDPELGRLERLHNDGLRRVDGVRLDHKGRS